MRIASDNALVSIEVNRLEGSKGHCDGKRYPGKRDGFDASLLRSSNRQQVVGPLLRREPHRLPADAESIDFGAGVIDKELENLVCLYEVEAYGRLVAVLVGIRLLALLAEQVEIFGIFCRAKQRPVLAEERIRRCNKLVSFHVSCGI